MLKLSDKLNISAIIPLILNGDTHAIVSGYRVKISGVRLTSFAVNGTDCICCGRIGAFFRVEDNSSGPHLNLYSYGSDGLEKLMTRDHIIPRAEKGPETVANMSTMCSRCNHIRGTKDQAQFILDWKAGKYAPGGELNNQLGTPGKPGSKKASLHEKYKSAIKRHREKFGTKSHMSDAFQGKGLSKKWKREELLAACIELKDEDGTFIMRKMLKAGDAWRKRMVKYYRQTYPTPVDTEMNAAKAFGILMTKARNQLENPNEDNAAKLRAHLKICKELR